MILGEIGPDLSRFPTEHHLAWGGLRPGQRIKSRRGLRQSHRRTAHNILPAAYHVLNQGVHHELGEEFFYRRDTENTERYRRRLHPPTPSPRPPSTVQPLLEAA